MTRIVLSEKDFLEKITEQMMKHEHYKPGMAVTINDSDGSWIVSGAASGAFSIAGWAYTQVILEYDYDRKGES